MFLCKINCPIGDGGLACACAAQHDNMELLNLALKYGCKLDSRSTLYAARHNNLKMLVFLIDSGCSCDNMVAMYASIHGNFEMLIYAVSTLKCSLDKDTCKHAVENGDLQMLEFAYENGCKFDSTACETAA